MTLQELSPLFPFHCYLDGLALLISPTEFYRLEGKVIDKSRMFLLVVEGQIDMELNGKQCQMGRCSFFDGMETSVVRIIKCSERLRAWCLLPTFKFASESLKNLRPGPVSYLLNQIESPIKNISEREIRLLEQQLCLLEGILNNLEHFYRHELAALYFKSFSLELGNIMYYYEECGKIEHSYISKRDFIALNFMKLVTAHFVREHKVEFYADALCISTKHLNRVVKEVMGKTPHAFICNAILHQAMALLEDDRISVSQIAEKLQFYDQASFCKFFKKQMTISPMEYRRIKRITPSM